jgi:type I restriction enzyme, S subunit
MVTAVARQTILEGADLAAETRVPTGYKRTELGVFPEDWQIKPIKNLNPYVTSGSRGWAAFYSDRGSPFIRITNLSRDCIYLDLSDLRFVNLRKNQGEAARTQLQDGDVLISITADIGIIGYVTATLPKPAYINQHIALMRFDLARTSSKFVAYFLSTEKPQRLFLALTDAGAKAGMNLTTVQQVCLALPPTKDEQDAIAEALSDADALIESLEQLLAKKRHLKQGAMQELLNGKQRLPGFDADWKTNTLGRVVTLQRGYDLPYRLREAGTVPIVTSSGIGGHHCEAMVAGPGVVTGRYGTIGEVFYIENDFWPLNTTLYVRDFHGNDPLFVSYFLRTIDFKSHSGKSGVPGVNRNDLHEVIVRIPPTKTEQEAIAIALSDIDVEIAALDAKLAKACSLKQGMMQELLTGRIRLA